MCDRAESPLHMTILLSDLPAYGCVQTPLLVSYIVRNRTLQVQEVEVTVEPSEAFMYSGHKQVRSSYFQHVKCDACVEKVNYLFLSQVQFRLLPSGDHRLKFSLYPLCAGFVTLPKLHFNLPRFQVSWDEHAQKMVPSNVFIKVNISFVFYEPCYKHEIVIAPSFIVAKRRVNSYCMRMMLF